jgi:hypothetical protein
MTDLQTSTGVENQAMGLQRLDFSKISDDGYQVVFKAQIGNMEIPDTPVFALTVTAASPGEDAKASAELARFLAGMRAWFALTAPEPDDDGADDENPEPFNIDTDKLIEAELIRPTANEGKFDVAMTVQATVEGFTVEGVLIALATGVLRGLAWLVRLRASYPPQPYYSVPPGGCHRYRVRRGRNPGAKVKVTSAKGEVVVRPPNPPNPGYPVYAGNTSPLVKAKTISVTGVMQSSYTVSAKYKPI